ncbi:hypothetical protein M0802_011354 [Mischocyttarus mexicanus]|nr:hypothetical protein M0802_011354 [Mischocyttarus mexicanus]
MDYSRLKHGLVKIRSKKAKAFFIKHFDTVLSRLSKDKANEVQVMIKSRTLRVSKNNAKISFKNNARFPFSEKIKKAIVRVFSVKGLGRVKTKS